MRLRTDPAAGAVADTAPLLRRGCLLLRCHRVPIWCCLRHRCFAMEQPLQRDHPKQQLRHLARVLGKDSIRCHPIGRTLLPRSPRWNRLTATPPEAVAAAAAAGSGRCLRRRCPNPTPLPQMMRTAPSDCARSHRLPHPPHHPLESRTARFDSANRLPRPAAASPPPLFHVEKSAAVAPLLNSPTFLPWHCSLRSPPKVSPPPPPWSTLDSPDSWNRTTMPPEEEEEARCCRGSERVRA